MNAYKTLALGAAAGFVFALSTGCPGTTCSPANCGGCCDTVHNKCIATSAQSATQCGQAGNACMACTGGATCTNGTCSSADAGPTPQQQCSITSVTGCCDLQGNNLPGSSMTNCGSGGKACSACPSGQVCQTSALGGTCQTPAPDAGIFGGFGKPCAQNSDCSSLGANGICLTSTSTGTPYPGGYCTLDCTTNASLCPQSGTNPSFPTCFKFGTAGFGIFNPAFFNAANLYGETRSICLLPCSTTFDCENARNDPNFTTADYGCFYGDYANGANADGTSAPGLGCWLNPPANAGETGAACPGKTYTECGGPPTSGFCVSPNNPPPPQGDGGPSGWPNGYCTQSCFSALFAQAINGGPNPDLFCGDGGTCIGDTTDANNNLIDAHCYESCSGPGQGQSNCRTGYACLPLTQTLPDGGTQPAPTGICLGACDQPGNGCNADAGAVCGDAGFCCIPQPDGGCQ